eukprot:900475-Prymnesium_polylepis.1
MYATSYGHEGMDAKADIFGLDEYANHYFNRQHHHNDVVLSDKHYHVLDKDYKENSEEDTAKGRGGGGDGDGGLGGGGVGGGNGGGDGG